MVNRKINALKIDVRFHFGKLSLLSFLLFFFTSLFFLNPSALSNKQNLKAANWQKYNISSSFYESELVNHNHKPLLNTTSNSSDQESSDENEISEETNDILDSSSLITSFSSLQIITGENFYLFQLTQTLQNCSTIALFVLHHSWKSFLI